jgi:hypothetical protein
MFKKPLVIATMTAALGIATLSTQASAGDPVLGALVGGGIGAAIGHNAGGRDGGVVGGVLGAIVGSSIAAESGRPYYNDGYYAPAPSYGYAPAYGYGYAPAYAGPTVVYSSGPYYRPYHPRYVEYRAARHEGRGDHGGDWRHR